MLPACWKNNRLEKSVVQIITKNSHQKWLVKMVKSPKLVSHQKNFNLGYTNSELLRNSSRFLFSIERTN
jgi:hypothetical protein